MATYNKSNTINAPKKETDNLDVTGKSRTTKPTLSKTNIDAGKNIMNSNSRSSAKTITFPTQIEIESF
jgi:hypothetical protein